MNHDRSTVKSSSVPVRYFYLITIFFLCLTGFAQMPVFKRYYIADVPGLAWLAQFYTTHYMHYLAAILLIALLAYMVVEYFALDRKGRKITKSAYVRGIALAGIVVTGVLLVIRNLAGTKFSPGFIIFLDLSHLGLVMTFLMVALYSLIFKKRWTSAR
jgi:hypothetical protein